MRQVAPADDAAAGVLEARAATVDDDWRQRPSWSMYSGEVLYILLTKIRLRASAWAAISVQGAYRDPLGFKGRLNATNAAAHGTSRA